MDPFKTPPRRSSRSSATNGIMRISKAELMGIFERIQFDEIIISSNSATERPDDTASFIEEIAKAFTSTLLANYPRKMSPEKLLQESKTVQIDSPTPFRPPIALRDLGSKDELDNAQDESRKKKRTDMLRAALSKAMALPNGTPHSHYSTLMRDSIGPRRPITPPPIISQPTDFNFHPRPELKELLRDEINSLSGTKQQPYTITSVSTDLDACHHPFVFVRA